MAGMVNIFSKSNVMPRGLTEGWCIHRYISVHQVTMNTQCLKDKLLKGPESTFIGIAAIMYL